MIIGLGFFFLPTRKLPRARLCQTEERGGSQNEFVVFYRRRACLAFGIVSNVQLLAKKFFGGALKLVSWCLAKWAIDILGAKLPLCQDVVDEILVFMIVSQFSALSGLPTLEFGTRIRSIYEKYIALVPKRSTICYVPRSFRPRLSKQDNEFEPNYGPRHISDAARSILSSLMLFDYAMPRICR